MPTAPLGTSEHRCAHYASDTERLECGRRWFAPALATGRELVVYVAADDRDPIAEWLRQTSTDAVSVLHADAVYGADQLHDREAIVAQFADLAATARGDGYDGIRAAADLTPFAVGAELSSLLRYELAIDAAMERLGLFGTCLYDASVVGDDLAALERVHDHGRADPWGVALRDGRLRLAGELDRFEATQALSWVFGALDDRDPIEIDLDDVAFIDAGTARVLHDFVARRGDVGAPVRLRGGTGTTRKVLDVFGLTVE